MKKSLLYVESTKEKARTKFNFLAMLADQDHTLLHCDTRNLTLETDNVKIRVSCVETGPMLKGCRFDSVVIDEYVKLTEDQTAWLAPIMFER